MTSSSATFAPYDPRTELVSSWLCRLENYLSFEKKVSEDEKRCAILAFLGATAFKRLYDKVPSDRTLNMLKFDEITALLKEIYEPGENIWNVRLEFRRIRQNLGESLDDFEARIRHAGRNCRWSGEELQMNLIEQFLGGLDDRTIQQAVLVKCASKKDMTEVFNITNELMRAKKATAKLRSAPSDTAKAEAVNKVHIGSRPTRSGPKRKTDRKIPSRQGTARACYRCGNPNHLAPDCPHKSAECRACSKQGHLSTVCRSSRSHHLLEEVPFNFVEGLDKTPINLKVHILNREVPMELDTGSGISAMELKRFREMFPNEALHSNDVRLRTATGEIFEPHSYALVPVTYEEKSQTLKLYLIDRPNFPTLFGRSWLRSLQPNSLNFDGCYYTELDYEQEAKKLLLKYPNLSKEGIGKIPNVEATLHLKDNPKPAYYRPRPVPHALLQLVDEELDHLERFDVIEKIDVSEWAHPVVIALRGKGDTAKKKARICGDFKVGLNQFLLIDDHPLRNIRYALDNIGVGKRFTKLDISNAFLHMPIREEDRKFVTVNTHRGLYRFKRMCNGLASAPAIYQRFMEGILAGVEGVEVVIDDIVISASTDEDHLKRLDAVLQRLDANDIRLNLQKCKFFAEEIQFCGFRLKHREIHKCDDKISCFKNAPIPQSISELKSFIGMIQFYSSFAPQLADLAHPLYRAFKGGSRQPLIWTKEMNHSFEAVKSEMCSSRTLVPFQPTKPLLLATDASSYGISAVLSHRYEDNSERPVAYYSRTLTDTEKRYTQLEKEALGIKEGVSRFFHYLFGRRFTLITDSKPLVSILSPSKALSPLAAMRMTHYSMFLQSFNYDIQYRNTDDHGNADMLSRLPVKSENFFSSPPFEDVLIMEITDDVPVDLPRIARETRTCESLKPLLKCLEGPTALLARKFWKIDISEFTIVEGAVFRGHRVVVPVSCRPGILSILHEGHFGSDKMKELARRYVWWDTLNAEIERLAKECMACAEHARQPPKSYHPWQPAERCFDRIHLDYAGPIEDKNLLLLVDAHSKWLEVFVSTTKTTHTTLRHLREAIARFGLPKVIVTDNDPTFASKEFNDFCRSNGISHKTSPPFNPPSNGQVERYVQTVKQGLKKIKSAGERDLHAALQRFLFNYRMVPNSSTNRTPAEAMLGRQIRSRLDLLHEQPRARFTPDETESQIDRSGRRPKFSIGDNVMARMYNRQQKWSRGKVVKLCGTKVAMVRTPQGISKRHYNQLRRLPDRISSDSDETEEESNPALFFSDPQPETVSTEEPVPSSSTDQPEFVVSETDLQTSEVGPEEPQESSLRKSARPTAGVPPQRYRPD